MTKPALTVGIGTRDRLDALIRCVRSLRFVAPLTDRVIVVDDASASPVEPALRAALGADVPPKLTVIRHEQPRGVSHARNYVAAMAETPWLLYLDDDAVLLDNGAVAHAVATISGDPTVAAIAFAQADEAGEPFAAQPAPVSYPAIVPTFIGFAHLLRREAMLAMGGYAEHLWMNGEERELCLRFLDAAWRVVYLPDARVAHLADPSGRDVGAFLHSVVRNDCLGAIRNEPLPMLMASLPLRLRRYFPMASAWNVREPGGFRRVLRAVAAEAPQAWRARRPVRWTTMREWRRLGRTWPRYEGPPA